MEENIQDIYPLSPMQQGMLFHSIFAPDTDVYAEQMACKLTGNLNIDAFKKAWEKVVERHDILRTAFVWEELEEPLQVVYKSADIPFSVQDWRDLSPIDQEKALEEFMRKDRKSGLDLSDAPLMRFSLMRLDESAWYFVWTHHHLLFDGWALPVILREVFLFYENFDQGKDIQLPPARPYREYIAWLKNQDMTEAENFWRNSLAGFSAPTPFVVDKKKQTDQYGYNHDRYILNDELSRNLHQLSHDHQLTVSTLIQGAWAYLLHRYSGEEDVVFGVTVSGRPAEIPGAEEIVGLFINTLPLRVQIDPQKAIIDWLKEIQLKQAELQSYSFTPLVQIQSWSDVPRDLPLFESIVVFENYPVGDQLAQKAARIQMSDLKSMESTNYPITIISSPGQKTAIDAAYQTNRFSKQTVQRLFLHLELILRAFTRQPNAPLNSVSVLTDEERQKVIHEWNQTGRPFPDHLTIHEWFENQVERTPDNIAVSDENGEITYRQLNQKTNQLANYLRTLSVGPDVLVGIALERSVELIIAIMAVWKAGGAYVPLVPEFPEERLQFMIEDSGVKLLITKSNFETLFESNAVPRVLLDSDKEKIERQSGENPPNINDPDNLAYVIYTSGSTGTPKGVLLHHKGACNTAQNLIKDFYVTDKSQVLQFSSFSFDGSMAEFMMSLLSGATLHIASRETSLNIETMTRFLNERQITTATLPPALLKLLEPEKIKSLKVLISVGDRCPWDLALRWNSGLRFLNGYGPTETTIGSIWGEVTAERDDTLSAPIGKPNGNVRVYVLDETFNPVPIGLPGELFISGVGVARGYLNRPDLTAERFLPDPFSDESGARMYRTGDLVRFLEDGSMEFVGRVDFQVKLRGYRVELGEIEAQLIQHPDIKDAVVIAREDFGDKYLAAYLLPADDKKPDVEALRQSLRQKLPDYMVPSAFTIMDSFPVTPSGKVNRRALPVPESVQTGDKYVAPVTPEEELIANIWSDVLHKDKIGIHDSFFDLGGHSLLATQVISRLQSAFEMTIPLKYLFEYPTIAELARQITILQKQGSAAEAPPLVPVSRDQELPLSYAQQRLWFLDQLQPGSWFNNIPAAIRLRGRLNTDILERCFNQMIERHETLRTTFDDREGKPIQVIREPYAYKPEIIDLSAYPENEREQIIGKLAQQDAREPFDLKNGPLFRSKLLRVNDEEYILLFSMHHIISDGWSMGIFVSEIAALYSALLEEREANLPELKIQYADYAYWQQNWLKDQALEKEMEYWRQHIGMNPPTLQLPLDFPRPAVQTFNGKTLSIDIPPEIVSKLKELSRQESVTLFMTMLAAFQTLLFRYSGQDEILVGSPIANRTRQELEHIIGFFVNNIVIKSDFTERPDFTELLRQIREHTLGAYAHQDVPFEKIVDELQKERDLSRSPIFQVMFVMQNLPESRFDLPGLTMEGMEEEAGSAKFDLSLVAMESGDRMRLDFEFNTDLFKDSTIRRMQRHFINLLDSITQDPEQRVDLISYLSESELNTLLFEWNKTAAPFDSELCVREKFEQWAQKQPGRTAVEHNDKVLSYKELNDKANQLAHYLRKTGISADDLVGICLERSLEMVIGIMGALKAGAAFVPLDPAYPDERLSFMIQDSGLKALLTQEALKPRVEAFGAPTICLDSEWEQIAQNPSDSPPQITAPENLAYVIYTSGSTGKPKGTMLAHRGLLNLANEQRKAFNITPESRILQFSSLSFDASVWETVMALLNGAALILVDREILASGDHLVQKIKEKRITTVTLPPSVLAVFPQEELPDLKTVITAGEKCSADLVKRWGKGRQFVNAYGPTETTVCASMYQTDPEEDSDPPIGRPIGNFELYVLDENLLPVPAGVPGELCVGGVGLARGYLNRPDLTAEKFIPDPFSGRPGSRLYRTGDLVRYSEDGNIRFLGRIDQQVKVRGFRIEPGEIEAALREIAQIKDVVVLAREDIPGEKRLVAYLVCDEPRPSVAELRERLGTELPDYMIPSAFMFLDAMPLTPNGKIDRKALPKPELDRSAFQTEYIAPRNENEEKLAQIVAELLHIEKVGIHDNFFELGGHSLLATQFMSRLRTTFQTELPLLTLFEKPTVAQLAEEIEKAKTQPAKAGQTPQIKRVSRAKRKAKRSDLQ